MIRLLEIAKTQLSFRKWQLLKQNAVCRKSLTFSLEENTLLNEQLISRGIDLERALIALAKRLKEG